MPSLCCGVFLDVSTPIVSFCSYERPSHSTSTPANSSTTTSTAPAKSTTTHHPACEPQQTSTQQITPRRLTTPPVSRNLNSVGSTRFSLMPSLVVSRKENSSLSFSNRDLHTVQEVGNDGQHWQQDTVQEMSIEGQHKQGPANSILTSNRVMTV
jgi:hypothetical protein